MRWTRIRGEFPFARGWESNSLNWAVLHLREQALVDLRELYETLRTSENGLTDANAKLNRERYGPNEALAEAHPVWWRFLIRPFRNPFILLLSALAAVSLVTDDHVAAVILTTMILASVLLRFFQEYRAALTVEELSKKTTISVTVLRRPDENSRSVSRDVPITDLAPGDIVSLSAGDMVPADMRLISSHDLFISQQILTGESLPAEKTNGAPEYPEGSHFRERAGYSVADLRNVCFMATNVISGTGLGVVIGTGRKTIYGSLAQAALGKRAATAFDKGIQEVSWLLIRFVGILLPSVLFLNGFTTGDWSQAFFFAVSVAVGLTPEMLPMIVAANLARGAINLSRDKVIVKHLHSVQNLGAIDVLCTDKTGTLTQDQIVLERHFDSEGTEDSDVWRLAYINSFFQTGLRNLLDKAILSHAPVPGANSMTAEEGYLKVDEVPFDFGRRRMSVIVEVPGGNHLLITKGASEEVLPLCSRVRIGDQVLPFDEPLRMASSRIRDRMSADGMRILAVAFREFSPITKRVYSALDESEMTMAGYIAFLDPPKASASQAIAGLRQHGVKIKILTGDNELVTRKICDWLGIAIEGTMLGTEVDVLGDEEMKKAVERVNLFAKLTPGNKARVIRALQSNRHVVGYIGDGINDALALRDADVGISVDSAADIARESADAVLTDKDLTVLERAIVEGRTAFGNTVKFIKTTASSNFGNVFTVVTASTFLPFLPMLPLQFLTQNLIYDFSQTAIPFDRMDSDYVLKPRRWNSEGIGWYMIIFGPLSSIFDFIMFAVLWWIIGANSVAKIGIFQTGWFVHGLVTQTLIVLVLRTQRIPFVQSWPTPALFGSSIAAVACAVALPYSPLAKWLHFEALPAGYFAWLVVMVIGYAWLTQSVKRWYVRRFGDWL